MIYLDLIAGVIYLLMGADLLVRGSVALARRTRVSPTLVAFTLVAFGTSLPELVIGVEATLAGYPGLVLGNVVGSNIANVMLVGGATALILPLPTDGETLRRDSLITVLVSGVFLWMCWSGGINRVEGWLLLAGLMVVLTVSAKEASEDHREVLATTPLDWVLGLPSRTKMIVVFLAAGLTGLPLGAQMVVESAVQIADQLGISTAIVGLTVVAISTSLPELATTAVAAWQRRNEVVMGTILGSNLFNLMGITGAAVLVSRGPVPVPEEFLRMDIPIMLGAAVVLAGFAWARRPLRKWHGGVLLAGYVAYTVLLLA
ncbi:MAG: calcium/sodium antiporter [Longimicrobiales bacterium]